MSPQSTLRLLLHPTQLLFILRETVPSCHTVTRRAARQRQRATTTGDDGDKERRDIAGKVVLPPPSPEVRIFQLDLDFAESSLNTHISAQVHRIGDLSPTRKTLTTMTLHDIIALASRFHPDATGAHLGTRHLCGVPVEVSRRVLCALLMSFTSSGNNAWPDSALAQVSTILPDTAIALTLHPHANNADKTHTDVNPPPTSMMLTSSVRS